MRMKQNNNRVLEFEDYDVAGVKNKKTIILVHGMSVTRKFWHLQMAALSEKYKVIAPDLPGHGEKSPGKFSINESVDLIKGIIDKNKYKKVLLAGLSLGGYIIKEFAVKYPEKTVGLVIVSSSAVPSGVMTIPYKIGSFLSTFAADWINDTDSSLFRKNFKPEVYEPILNAGLYYENLQDVVGEVEGRDFLSDLKDYENPVLIINGEKDLMFRKDEELYLKSIKNSKLAVIEKAGHLCNLEEPHIFNSHILEFADSLKWK